jgi:hypothetical protein
LTTNTTQAGAVALVKSLPYDPAKDFPPPELASKLILPIRLSA